ncbi:ribose-5-phosphate isomerase RpiA [Niallia sp. 01092]|uniref:ribose-5-phosphate isomerase RpiA n=1 Tax=unclassified Niallia TaxID=2837522 RepID=UPI003FD25398
MNEKAAVGEKAASEYVKDGMTVGLGTGTTVYYTIVKLAELVKNGFRINGVATSVQTENLANKLGIPLLKIDEVEKLDVAIDGADEIDSQFNAIKGGGGALLREKVIANAAEKFIVIADSSKLVSTLGSFPLPVEVVPFGATLTEKQLRHLGCTTSFRQKEKGQYVTDNGNYLIDCCFSSIQNPKELELAINNIPGVVENGLFVNRIHHVVTLDHHKNIVIKTKMKDFTDKKN